MLRRKIAGVRLFALMVAAIGIMAASYSYAACSGPSAFSLDVSNVFHRGFLSAPQGIDVEGNYAYITTVGTGWLSSGIYNDKTMLTILDISAPASPKFVSYIMFDADGGSYGSYVDVVGNYAYVIAGDEGILFVVDITDKQNPVEVGSTGVLANLDTAVDIKVVGDFAYIPCYAIDALTVIDVTTKTAPVEADSITSTALNGAYGVDVDGSYAYVTGADSNQLSIVNITNKYVLTEQGATGATLSQPQKVRVSGSYAYVTEYSANSLAVVDISNPSAPSEVASTGASNQLNGLWELELIGNTAFVSSWGNGGVGTVDITTPLSPSVITNWTTEYWEKVADGQGIWVEGNYAYMTGNFQNRVYIFDITTDPMTEVSSIAVGSNPSGIQKDGNYLYVVDRTDDNLRVIDVTNPASPSQTGITGTLANLAGAWRLEVVGDYVYVAAYDADALTIIDVTTKSSPVEIGSTGALTNLNGAYGLDVEGNYAYVGASLADAFTIIDVTTKSSPVEIGSISSTASLADVEDVVVSGNLAYVVGAGASSGDFTVIDITTKSAPAEVANLGGLYLGGSAMGVSGNYAYIAKDLSSSSNKNSVYVVDISKPTAPRIVGSTSLPKGIENASAHTVNSKDAFLLNSKFYVVGYGDELAVIDVSDPFKLVIEKSTSPIYTNAPSTMAVSGSNIHMLADSHRLMTTLDVSTPSDPSLVSFYKPDMGMEFVEETRIYATDDDYIFVFQGYDVVYVFHSGDGGYISKAGEVRPGVDIGGLIAIDGNYLYDLDDNTKIVRVFDISNRTNWKLVGTSGAMPNIDSSSYNMIVGSGGDYLYVTGNINDSITIIDVTSKNNPYETGFVTDAVALNGANHMVQDGNYLYVTALDGDALAVVNVTTKSAPSVSGSVSHTDLNGASNVVLHSSKDYVIVYAADLDELVTVDVQNPAVPAIVAKLPQTIECFNWIGASDFIQFPDSDIFFTDSYWRDGVCTWDMSDPLNPVEKSILVKNELDGSWGMALSGDKLFVMAAEADAIVTIPLTNMVSVGGGQAVLSACAVGDEGAFNYDKANNVFRFCNGTNWIPMGSSTVLGECSPEGALKYDITAATYKFCNGGTWVQVASTIESGCTGADNGAIVYDTTNNILKWCDGTNWLDLTGQANAEAKKCAFVTSTTYDGNDLPTIYDADAACNVRASAASLGGYYKAWMGHSASTDPESRFSYSLADYELTDGTVVANGWDDLTDGTIDNPINKTELNTAAAAAVWTAINTNGTATLVNDCTGWTSTAGTGDIGSSGSVSGTWTANGTQSCASTLPVYCFEQGSGCAIPAPFPFTDLVNQPQSTQVSSEVVQVNGLDCTLIASIAGDGSPEYRICSDVSCTVVDQTWGTASQTITDGKFVQVRLTTAGSNAVTNTATLTIGERSNDFRAATFDDNPMNFVFTDLEKQTVSTQVTSDIVEIIGIDPGVTISISGNSGEYRICADFACAVVNNTWSTSAGTIDDGEFVQLRQMTSGTPATMLGTTLTVGQDSDQWDVTTEAAGLVVFITSGTYDGTGSVSGMNSKCQAAADAGTVPASTYKAWISNSFTSTAPVNRFNGASGTEAYILHPSTGTIVANTWADLVDGTIATAINRDENNNLVSAASNVWTNVNSAGSTYNTGTSGRTTHCVEWSTGAGNKDGHVGSSNATDATWTDTGGIAVCSTLNHLYCFEDP